MLRRILWRSYCIKRRVFQQFLKLPVYNIDILMLHLARHAAAATTQWQHGLLLALEGFR
jgi:hypothetical protein